MLADAEIVRTQLEAFGLLSENYGLVRRDLESYKPPAFLSG